MSEARAVVTNNLRDYRPRAAQLIIAGGGHHGMIYVPANFRRTRQDVGRIVAALERILTDLRGTMRCATARRGSAEPRLTSRRA